MAPPDSPPSVACLYARRFGQLHATGRQSVIDGLSINDSSLLAIDVWPRCGAASTGATLPGDPFRLPATPEDSA